MWNTDTPSHSGNKEKMFSLTPFIMVLDVLLIKKLKTGIFLNEKKISLLADNNNVYLDNTKESTKYY